MMDFNIEDYYKIKNHTLYHRYSLFDLMTEYDVCLWGGSPILSEAVEDYEKTIITCRRTNFGTYGNNRVAILKMTKDGFTLVKYCDV